MTRAAFVAWAGPWIYGDVAGGGWFSLGPLRSWREIPVGCCVVVYTHLEFMATRGIHDCCDSAVGWVDRAVARARALGAWIGVRTDNGIAWNDD